MNGGTTLRTVDEELVGTAVAEKLRVAFQKVQACKRGDAKLDMQPVWDIINLVPAAVALLDKMPEFQRDLEVEQLSNRVERLDSLLGEVGAWLEDNFCGGDLRERIRRARSGEHQLPRESDR